MKRVILSTILASATLFASSDGDSAESTTLVANQSSVNEVVTTTAIVATKVYAKPSAKNVNVVAAQALYSDKVKIINIPFSYDITKQISVIGALPLVQNKGINNKTNIGLGDISLGMSYTSGAIKKGMNIATLRYKSTTGDEDSGLGAGTDAITLSDNFTQKINAFMLNANVAYTFNSIGIQSEDKDHMTHGDAYMMTLGASRKCLLNDKVITSVKLAYFHSDNNSDNFGGKVGETTASDLWVEWFSNKYANNLPISGGIKIPIQSATKTWGGTNHDTTFQFYVSAATLY